MLQWDVHGVRNNHPYHATVANDQHILARKLLLPVVPAINNTVVEVLSRLTTRRRAGNRVSPEPVEPFAIAGHYLIRRAPFPFSEVDLPQAFILVQGDPLAICQFLSKVHAT